LPLKFYNSNHTEKTKIIIVFEKNGSRKMRFRKPQRGDVGDFLLRCLRHDTSDSVPVSGPLLMVILFFLGFKLTYGLT
jgi:hypothetical protein